MNYAQRQFLRNQECCKRAAFVMYTAISIYVVGSKLQGYGTRPKGGMGRLELILGFRGCRREMDMDIGDLRCIDEALLILLITIH